ncbi:DUF4365 domain-containing protein [Arthrobacter sp. NPDC056493]|uniref:DUF4365 domain-containing protein n=1 Tax=Arthrobacter sp. NPDC056493 TaxID=3345839 RepID=UPI0036710796
MSSAIPIGSTLSPNARKGRYGIAYFQNVCAQFGVGFDETSADEDVLAIDGTVQFPALPVRIQIKCTKKVFGPAGKLSWPVTEEWKTKWARNFGPAYFVVVQVPNDIPGDWIEYGGADITTHRSTAYWAKIDTSSMGGSISIHRTNRLTPDTLAQWNADLWSCFSEEAA